MALTRPPPDCFLPVDDSAAAPGLNGKQPLASHIHPLITRLNAIQYTGRTLHHWVGGNRFLSGDAGGDIEDKPIVQQVWNHYHTAGNRLRGQTLTLPYNHAHATGQGIKATTTLASGSVSTTFMWLRPLSCLKPSSGLMV